MPYKLPLLIDRRPPPCVSDASRALPEFPDIDLQGKSLPEGVELEHIKSFQLLYREHCEVKPTLPAGAASGSCVRLISVSVHCKTGNHSGHVDFVIVRYSNALHCMIDMHCIHRVVIIRLDCIDNTVLIQKESVERSS